MLLKRTVTGLHGKNGRLIGEVKSTSMSHQIIKVFCGKTEDVFQVWNEVGENVIFYQE